MMNLTASLVSMSRIQERGPVARPNPSMTGAKVQINSESGVKKFLAALMRSLGAMHS